MQINPKIVKRQFEKSMDSYGENAIVQSELAKKLIEAVVNIDTNYEKILELGCGTGVLTKEIVKSLKYNKYFANDLIKKSKNYITEIIPDCQFVCGNAQKISLNTKFDLIISNAMFQWFKDLEKSLLHFVKLLEKNGVLAFTTFSSENFKELKEIAGVSLDYKTVDELKKIIEKQFDILYSYSYTQKLEFKSPLELLAHLKSTGVNSLSSSHWTFKEVKSFCEKYNELYPKFELTYAPVIIIAKLK